MLKQFIAFGLVGVFGFSVDAGVLYIAKGLGAGLFLGRIASYLTAATMTWMLNRRFTFSARRSTSLWVEWLKFLISQLFGAAVNIGLFWWLVSADPRIAAQPVWAVAIGSLAGMCINFTVARKFVFS